MGHWALPKKEGIVQNEDMADKEPATKADIRRLEGVIRDQSGDIGRLDTGFKRLAQEVVKTQATIASVKTDMMDAIRRSHSTILERIDRFMMQSRKVTVDQTFLVHRVDKLEKRVDSLEARPS